MRLGSASCGAEAHEPTQCALFSDFPDASPQAWAAMAASNNKTLAAITKCLRESALRTLDESVPSKTFAPHGAGGALKLRWRPRRCQSYNKFTVNVTAEPKSRFQFVLPHASQSFCFEDSVVFFTLYLAHLSSREKRGICFRPYLTSRLFFNLDFADTKATTCDSDSVVAPQDRFTQF
jgi:hypothetical protein